MPPLLTSVRAEDMYNRTNMGAPQRNLEQLCTIPLLVNLQGVIIVRVRRYCCEVGLWYDMMHEKMRVLC